MTAVRVMIDADTFLTAAHCTTDWPDNVKFYVSLDQDVQAGLDKAAAQYPGDPAAVAEAVAVRGSAHNHPAYRGPERPRPPGPRRRRLHRRRVRHPGSPARTRRPHPPGGGVRMKAPVTYNALNDAWLRLSMTAPQGNGGACYGDSGGPNFATLAGRRTLVATTITGDTPCYATNVTYRLDTPGARASLSPFTKLP
ncbi:hypothetical protein [Streptomyces sp. NPDC055287]